jgi:hypothetical protein
MLHRLVGKSWPAGHDGHVRDFQQNHAVRVDWGSSPHTFVPRRSIPRDFNKVMTSMHRLSISMRLALIGVVAGFGFLMRADAGILGSTTTAREGESAVALAGTLHPEAFQVQAAATAPRFVYGSGAQGFGYYAAPAPRAATATTPRSTTPSSVGPGARNWSTGRRSPLHRPWMRPQ